MLLRKYMTLLGIGSAKIDLILQKETYRPGDAVIGHFLLKGGIIDQQIKRIDCDLYMIDHVKNTEMVVDSVRILSTSSIISDEDTKYPFSFKLPDSVPASSKEITYCFKTKLTFDKGIESRDEDDIQIIS
jgi:sporulation-control protein